jgi:3D-(3,5/4)-trihydroxycyclohexane-1,2-dione acylhydrolase (decyclizing)
MLATHPLNIGPIGVTGSDSANAIAERADVMLAVGTRLQDFTTGSWTAFAKDARLIGLNVGRHDAAKHLSHAGGGRCEAGAASAGAALAGYTAPADWTAFAKAERAKWDAYVADNVAHGNRPQLLRAGHRRGERALRSARPGRRGGGRVAGGGDGQLAHAGYRHGRRRIRLLLHGLRDLGRLGRAHRAVRGEPDRDTIVFVGDGSYLLMNSDIYSSVLTRKKLIVLVLDNGGFAVINKLQNNTGQRELQQPDRRLPHRARSLRRRFRGARALHGRRRRHGGEPGRAGRGVQARQGADKTSVIVMQVDPYEGWTAEGHTWWEVGTPQVSDSANVREKHAEIEAERARQRQGV